MSNGTVKFVKHCNISLEKSATSENTNTEEIPTETPNGQDTSCYQLSNGGQIHDVRNTDPYGIKCTINPILMHCSLMHSSLIYTPF